LAKVLLTLFLIVSSLITLAQEVNSIQVVEGKDDFLLMFDLNGSQNGYDVEVALSDESGFFYVMGVKEFLPGKCTLAIEEPFFCSNGVFRITAKSRKVKDIDGNLYETVRIGNQLWFKENLNVSRYRNGDKILTNLSDTEWGKTEQGACANSAGFDKNKAFGKLYNYFAIADYRELCPVGWHVADVSDWTKLENAVWGKDHFLGERSPVGGWLKSDSDSWISPNSGANNESNFSALPAGSRTSFGGYYGIGFTGWWWCDSSEDHVNPWTLSLKNSSANSFWTRQEKRNGFSVRCVKN
jgi:uncharacterized protein (TIGR02145 family)